MEEKPLSARDAFYNMASELMQEVDTGKISMETAEKIVTAWEAALCNHQRLATEQLERQYSGLPTPLSPHNFLNNLIAACKSGKIDIDTYLNIGAEEKRIAELYALENQLRAKDKDKNQQHHDGISEPS